MSATLAEPIPASDDQDPSALAQEWGLAPSAQRQSPGAYNREFWVRRNFIIAPGTGRKSVAYGNTSLGRAWLMLSPILNAIVYYFIFGVLLRNHGWPADDVVDAYEEMFDPEQPTPERPA